ncbi:MAG: SPFH/Band 7/PHB domain protein [Candidatus Fermentithermobacillus carboniphilus]|uniref:SPFH/Band 7/PHB domain protein n=1 Tax=Candidatus Fermentithermobacillus carboniphilus TaxID=3085328 RepID=A0AAT9LAY7_9FIRM|nr:MAG: SPFH/Band 7/PHB domain protein [Candidatus Fermentithermobacillus carboniphilus]
MEILVGMSILLVLVFAATSVKVIHQSRVGIVERLGKFHGVAQTGVNILIPFIDHMRAIIDMREQVVDYPPQPVITKDNVTMQIDTVVYYQVTDPVKYTYEIANPRTAIEYLTATTLRNIVGDMDLDQTLTSRDVVNAKLRSILDEATDKWGIKVTRVELKNIAPPRDIQDAMEKQMRAERERREAILKAEGEKKSAILRAEGEREAQIQKAEGERQAAILRAQGEAEAILAVQRAKAEAIKMVYNAIKEADPTREVVAIRSLEALEKVADGKATKIIVPVEAAGVLGALSGIKGILENEPKAGLDSRLSGQER